MLSQQNTFSLLCHIVLARSFVTAPQNNGKTEWPWPTNTVHSVVIRVSSVAGNPRCSFPPQISAVFLHRAFLMSFCGQAYESVKIRSIRLIRVLFHFAKNFYMHPRSQSLVLTL